MKLAVVLAAVILLASGCGGGGGPSPRALYHRLATRQLSADDLPHGFRMLRIKAMVKGRIGWRYHAIGEVGVKLAGPDVADFIYYAIYPSSAAALAAMNSQPDTVEKLHPVAGGIPGFANLPNRMFFGTIPNSDYGVTIANVVESNIEVTASTGAKVSGQHPAQGDTPRAMLLMKAALRHLARLR